MQPPPLKPVRWGWWFAIAGVLLVAAVIAMFGWLDGEWTVVRLSDLGQPVDLALADSGKRLPGGPSGLSVHITGEIDGVVEVWADDWAPKRLSGRVDWQVYHDWFSPDCTLHFRPMGKASGQLQVRYQFQ